jgi:YVTN family beta-propeller protein
MRSLNRVTLHSILVSVLAITLSMAAMTLGTRPAKAAPLAYVTNRFSDTISVIATASNAVVATIPVGDLPVGVAITPNGKFAYVTNQSSATVSMIATASNTVVAIIPVGDNPVGVAITRKSVVTRIGNAGFTCSAVSNGSGAP